MMSTPKGRATRSNSNSNTAISLQDIHNLINNTKTELMLTVKEESEKLNKVLTTLTERVTGLEERLDIFDLKQQKQESEIKEIKDSLKWLNSDPIKFEFEEICNETTERWKKRKYLIVSGIAEHSSGDVEERREKDAKMISLLAQEMGVEVLEPEEVSRIGRVNPAKPRLLRFKCEDSDARRQMLRNSKNLRKSERFQGTYINPDLTKNQRIRSAELRKEVKKRRESGENVGIRRGQIVDLTENKNFH